MATAGYTTQGGTTENTGFSGNTNWPGGMITMPSAGDITKITAYCSNTVSSFSPRCTIYAGSAGARSSSVIGATTTSSTGTSFALTDFNFSSVFGASATTYWLQFEGDGGNGPGGNVGQIKYDAGGAANTSYVLSDIGVPVYDSKQYTLYATYNPAGGGGPSWSIALK